MAYQLDQYQHIVGLNMKVLPADYAVCYARLDPPHSVLVGYALVIGPLIRDLINEGTQEDTSVGDWAMAIIPRGSDHRSYPELDNGAAHPLPTRLPTMEELEDVYIWHVGRSHAWGLSDQIIVNVKKLREDYPSRDDFTIGMASHTWEPMEGGDGDPIPPPDDYDASNKKDLSLFVGLRTYAGDGGEFEFSPITTLDPFNNSVELEDIVHYHGSNVEMSANFEQAAAVAPIELYNSAFETTRSINWGINVKRPKFSALTGGPIRTESA